ncbi:hypothetical protein [uncultured Rikenella sp.]|nr:hypothetical protein [uncultured Rikenella sp.]
MSSVGNDGYRWSSTANDTNSIYLGFGATWLDPSRANYRSYGFQLRCLSE